MKFILIRHATTEWNSTGRIQGQTDIGLSQQGKTEATELAKSLFGLGIDSIVSSDLKRASETAEIISALFTVPLGLDSRIRECSFGEIEGLTRQQALEKYGSSLASNWDDEYLSYDFRPFGGENRDSVFKRHIDALKSLASKKSNSVMLLVGHGRGLWTLLGGLGYLPDLKRGEYRIIEYS